MSLPLSTAADSLLKTHYLLVKIAVEFMSRFQAYICCMLLCSCISCAPHALHIQPDWESKPKSVEIEDIPAFAQDPHQCGATALASVLCWTGIQTSPEELASQVYDPKRKGTLQSSLLSAARRQGRVGFPIRDPDVLFKELRAGHPVLVLLNKGLWWWPVWHYALVCGYEGPNQKILMAAGKSSKEKIAWSSFYRMWLRADEWGMLVLPPNDLPATASAQKWLRAVHGLELAGQYEQALIGYTSALDKWPFELAAMMGKANSLYALDRLKEAEKTLRRTFKMHPDSGPVLNNLAQVLLEQGKIKAARQAINKALEHGGPYTEAFHETRTEIRSRAQRERP